MEAFPDEPFPELRQGVRRLLERFPETYWRELDEREAYPEEFVRAMTEAGYLAALIPEAYGGAGLGVQEASVILEEVHRAGGNAAACHAQMYILGALVRHGSEEQKARYLPKLARGELRLQAFGVTEPDAGSDTLSIRTFAERRGDRYVIHGQKIWTSRALYSDLMLLLARTTPPDQVRRRGEGLSLFLVNLKENLGKTIHIRPIKTMINHHTTEVFLDGLEVPVEDRIGEEGKGFRYILDGMNAERILIAAECIGDGYYFIRKAAEYARERWVFGRPIGQNQGIQFPLAQAYARIRAADLMRFRAAERYDQGLACGPEANMAKLLAAEASWEAANAALQTFGGFGFAKEFHIERKFRETRLYQVAPVSTNLILAYLAHNVLGLPKSY
uniref:Acyl-CoA dehydrogenase n=1 Tax=Thermus caliditerrae TaxID=1330700 RepID=A0A7C5REZ0_9DEIN